MIPEKKFPGSCNFNRGIEKEETGCISEAETIGTPKIRGTPEIHLAPRVTRFSNRCKLFPSVAIGYYVVNVIMTG